MTHKIFNASNLFGTIAFFAMILAAAFVEENPIMSIVMGVILAVSAYLALKEDGKIK